MNLTDYSEITELLRRHNFRFSKSMGQNFLTDASVPEEIAEAAGLDENTLAVEVGPGIGCLTVQLSERAGKVISYELDRALMPVLSETLSGCENTQVIFRDFMKTPEEEILSEAEGRKIKFVANIPYNITSPLLTKVISSGIFDEAIVMIQKEVAQRICAGAGERDYSSFGILCQWHTEPEILFDVGPECFVPRPKVTSAVIRLKKRTEKPAKTEDEKLMFALVRAAFNQRRKTFVNAAGTAVPGVDREMLKKVLENLGFDEKTRGETLSIGDFAKIADEIKRNIVGNL